jgi:hypothetical protein
MFVHQLISIASGTYLYTEKSNSNFLFQRKSYSGQKKRNLVKPMMMVCSDGYIVGILGPYLARNNDASILRDLLKENVAPMRMFLDSKAVLIVDRGFRDVVEFANALGYDTLMPSFLAKKQRQHPDLEANQNRLVTKLRWVVESANSRLKRWKYFKHTIPNTCLPSLAKDLQIMGAIINRFRPPLVKTTDSDIALARLMKQRASVSNSLAEKCKPGGVFGNHRQATWKQLDATEIPDFPKLEDEHIEDLCFGVYQLKIAKPYAQQHFSVEADSNSAEDNGNIFKLNYCKIQDGVIHCRLESRHKRNGAYNVYIQYKPNITAFSSVFDVIEAWYCTCKCGARTLGTCAHCASVIWFLGKGRHLHHVKSSLTGLFDDVQYISSDSDSNNDAGSTLAIADTDATQPQISSSFMPTDPSQGLAPLLVDVRPNSNSGLPDLFVETRFLLSIIVRRK